MLALMLDGTPRLVRDHPRPSPAVGEALVRVQLAGICATDLELVRGYKQFQGVLGHEFVGLVEAADDDRWIGQRVVGEINVGCGSCSYCRSGMPSQCPARTAVGILGRDGAFAEYLTLPLGNLHPVPDSMPDDVAVFCELVAAALQVTELVHIRPSDRVAVLGDGKLGLLVSQVVATTGAYVHLVGRHPRKLALAAGWGIAIQPPPDRVDVVVDCTNSPTGFSAALELVRPRGTVVLKSTSHSSAPVELAPVVVNEIKIVGSRCGPFQPAIASLEVGQIEVKPLVEARYPLEEAIAALKHAEQRGALKVLIEI